jgi:hypothetical protein
MEALTSAGLQTQQAMTTGDRGAERVAGGTVSGNDTRREGDS